jgi:serine/threonine-protein kinase
MSGNDCTVRGATLPVPKTLFGYEVVDVLGQGAGSVLYVVNQPVSRQLCALKRVVRNCDHDDRYVQQLENEYEIGRRVVNPALRRCFELKYHRNWLHKVVEAALLMELVDGTPLDQLDQAAISQEIKWFRAAAEALHALHGLGYVHCDIKPGNILSQCTGGVKVIDFGQSCPIRTRKTRIQGSPDYIAPEQVRCDPVTPRTDVYNLGATMYWSLCRHHVPTLYTMYRSGLLRGEQTQSPHELNPQVPETLSNLIMECIRTDPAKRPSGMDEIAKRLEIIRHGLRRQRRGMAVASPGLPTALSA